MIQAFHNLALVWLKHNQVNARKTFCSTLNIGNTQRAQEKAPRSPTHSCLPFGGFKTVSPARKRQRGSVRAGERLPQVIKWGAASLSLLLWHQTHCRFMARRFSFNSSWYLCTSKSSRSLLLWIEVGQKERNRDEDLHDEWNGSDSGQTATSIFRKCVDPFYDRS